MKLSECAYDADVAENTVRRWAKDGKLKVKRRGFKEIFVEPEEWEAFCREHNIKRRAGNV